jgi:hypothetical protein
MSREYIRPMSDHPAKGFRPVTLPAFNNEPEVQRLVYDNLATELEHLVSRGRIREARTLFFWFDGE